MILRAYRRVHFGQGAARWPAAPCGARWPCEPREQALDELTGAVPLTAGVRRDCLEAATELPTVAAEDLHARFFWYRYGRADRRR
jgi:hypothetical protein